MKQDYTNREQNYPNKNYGRNRGNPSMSWQDSEEDNYDSDEFTNVFDSSEGDTDYYSSQDENSFEEDDYQQQPMRRRSRQGRLGRNQSRYSDNMNQSTYSSQFGQSNYGSSYGHGDDYEPTRTRGGYSQRQGRGLQGRGETGYNNRSQNQYSGRNLGQGMDEGSNYGDDFEFSSRSNRQEYSQTGRPNMGSNWRSQTPDYTSIDQSGTRGRTSRSASSQWDNSSSSESTDFFGKGPKSYRRSDDRIKEDVCDCLTDHPNIDASEIDVEVTSGTVKFSGTVPSTWMKYEAESIVEEISGVSEIDNGLKVKKEGQGTSQSTGSSKSQTSFGSSTGSTSGTSTMGGSTGSSTLGTSSTDSSSDTSSKKKAK